MTDVSREPLGQENRKHVRIEICLRASFMIAGDETERVFRAVTSNISRGGICLKFTENKDEILGQIGDSLPRFSVSLDLKEDDRPLDVYVETAWISSKVGWLMTPTSEDVPLLIGMALEGLAEEDEEKINSFIPDILIQRRESIFREEKEGILSRIMNRTMS